MFTANATLVNKVQLMTIGPTAEHKGGNWGMQVDGCSLALCSATHSVVSSGICQRIYQGPCLKDGMIITDVFAVVIFFIFNIYWNVE